MGQERCGKRSLFQKPNCNAKLDSRMQTGATVSKREDIVGSAEPGAADSYTTRRASTRAVRRTSGNIAFHTAHEVDLKGAAAIPGGAAVIQLQCEAATKYSKCDHGASGGKPRRHDTGCRRDARLYSRSISVLYQRTRDNYRGLDVPSWCARVLLSGRMRREC